MSAVTTENPSHTFSMLIDSTNKSYQDTAKYIMKVSAQDYFKSLIKVI